MDLKEELLKTELWSEALAVCVGRLGAWSRGHDIDVGVMADVSCKSDISLNRRILMLEN